MKQGVNEITGSEVVRRLDFIVTHLISTSPVRIVRRHAWFVMLCKPTLTSSCSMILIFFKMQCKTSEMT